MLGPPFTEGVIRALTAGSFGTSEHLRFAGFAPVAVQVFQEESLRTAEMARFVAAARQTPRNGRPKQAAKQDHRVRHHQVRLLPH